MSEIVDYFARMIEQTRRSVIDGMPLLFLRNPTPTRVRIRLASRPAKIVRYLRSSRYMGRSSKPRKFRPGRFSVNG